MDALPPSSSGPPPRSSFADYKVDGRNWITLATGEYYPDVLKDAVVLYEPVLVLFSKYLRESESSIRLLLRIAEEQSVWMRIQLARVFRKYVSPETPVEMLKKKSRAQQICDQFGTGFRPIHIVQAAFDSRPLPDEALCALLWEYKDRGKKGYDITSRFFALFRQQFPSLVIKGPERAGRDIRMGEVFADYPRPTRPVDFVVYDESGNEVLAIGLARYDSDRGGAQEDDRVGGYISCADEILGYAQTHGLKTKVMFMNDGPGLLLGSMWNDYAAIERSWPGKIIVFTLRMMSERVTLEWLKSQSEAADGDRSISNPAE
ncbi:MAG: bstEII [Candidatus Chloroheliales bacterium]|nr:MAG: bstEII [Chloroflexota bacterium]